MKEIFKNFISDLKSVFLKFINQNGFWKKFAFVYGTYFVGILSLLQANYLYKTDLSRVADAPYEIVNWSGSGRLLNDLFILLFHFDAYPQDISPLSELLAIAALSFASMILVYTVCRKVTYPKLLFSTVLGLNPYFLQILCYVFDCLFYSIGMLMAVFPFIFYKKNNVFNVISAVCVLCCYMIFQSTISVYMVITTYLLFMDYQNKKIPFKKLFNKALTIVLIFLGISLLYYIIVRLSFPAYAPAIEQSNLCALSDCWNTFSANIRHTLVNVFYHHWKSTPMGYAFLGVLVSFFIYMLHQAFQSERPYPRAVHIFVALATMFLMLFFIILWTMFFTFIYWNARIWTAFGCCFVIMMLATADEKQKILRRLFMTASFILVWGSIVFVTRVGNLIEIQKRYESFVFFTLAQDLTAFPHKDLIFDFKPISSPIVKSKAKQYPIIRDLVTALQPKYNRFNYYFMRFYRPDLQLCLNQEQKMKKVVLKNAHHKFIQINDKCIKVRFRQ